VTAGGLNGFTIARQGAAARSACLQVGLVLAEQQLRPGAVRARRGDQFHGAHNRMADRHRPVAGAPHPGCIARSGRKCPARGRPMRGQGGAMDRSEIAGAGGALPAGL